MKFKIAESIEDKGILKAIFMAGSPGAGKSYTISKISSGTISPRIVNTDKFIEGYFGARDQEEQRSVLDTSIHLTQSQLLLYLNSMLPLYVDSTSTHATTITKRNGLLQSIGYDTGMVFINTSLETALKRTQDRDREVSTEWVKLAYEKVMDAKEFYKSRMPFFYEINNDEGELTDSVISKAYKKVKGFYDAPIENPEGRRIVESMKSDGLKYLSDGIYSEEYLKKLISVWYMK